MMKDFDTDEELFGGREIVTAHMKKTGAGWQIRDLYATEIRNDIRKYICPYEVFQKNTNEMVITVKYPNGKYFENEYLNVNFKELSGGNVSVQTNKGQECIWEKPNFGIKEDDEGRYTPLGRPNSESQVIEAIIMYNHKGVCTDVVMNQ